MGPNNACSVLRRFRLQRGKNDKKWNSDYFRRVWNLTYLKCIWQFFFFFICSVKSPKCTEKKIFDSDFPSPCFDVPKASNFTSGGVQNRETKNRRLGTIVTSFQDFKLREKQISPTFSYFLINNALLYHFLANWLAHNKKMTEKSVFREAWSPEMTSQSFPVSCFWSRGFVPHRKWNLTLLDAFGTSKHGKGKSLSKKLFCYTYQYIREI